jgi:hypothetical protein
VGSHRAESLARPNRSLRTEASIHSYFLNFRLATNNTDGREAHSPPEAVGREGGPYSLPFFASSFGD